MINMEYQDIFNYLKTYYGTWIKCADHDLKDLRYNIVQA